MSIITTYIGIMVFIVILALLGLYVGVSNDAVNFLNSAIGAKTAKFRTILIIASAGVLLGALTSNGMMDITRNGVICPSFYSFREVMIIFLAVMIANVIVIDIFNTLGFPTSTTVTLVFGLLGAAVVMATAKLSAEEGHDITDLINTGKALEMIIAIFLSVAVAFVFGTIVQWLSRLLFTFNYRKYWLSSGVFGGVATTILCYFIFIKGLGQSNFNILEIIENITKSVTGLEKMANFVPMLLLFVFFTATMAILSFFKVNVFRIIVLMGTFALAMAFAGNDLVNFIGIPLAAFSSLQDYMQHGTNVDTFTMSSLNSPAKTPFIYLIVAAIIMIFAMITSKKAQSVIKTSVDLSRQDEGDNMFGTSRVAQSLVKSSQAIGNALLYITPQKLITWIDKRFENNALLPQGAAFDMLRASINLVLAALLIIVGTTYKLPLSTTYVTFMVAMGTSLADKAWGRDTAVFRITGVISVIGGWFVTAGAAFFFSAIICALMNWGGLLVMLVFMVITGIMLIRSNRQYQEKLQREKPDQLTQLMIRSKDPEIVWNLLKKHVIRTQSFIADYTTDRFNEILEGLYNDSGKGLRRCKKSLSEQQEHIKKIRKNELIALHHIPMKLAIERNTWYHLGINSDQQLIYCLKRLLEPIKEHVDNSFRPMPKAYIEDFASTQMEINRLMRETATMIGLARFDDYRKIMEDADNCKDQLSVLRKKHLDTMHWEGLQNGSLQMALLYLNLLQESQQILSNLRHQLRAAKKFLEE